MVALANRPWSGPRLCQIISLLLLVALAARWRTFDNPVIGFDEQFYLLVGDRLRHGLLPFVDIFDRKPIGLFLLYAAASATGGDPFVRYKLLALVFVVATAVLIVRVTRHRAEPLAALTAGCFYIAWLNLMEGEGGQAPVFYNLPMMAAAAMITDVTRRSGSPRRIGAYAMTLVGLAMQIKYSVVFEGVFFGCWLIVVAWGRGEREWTLLGSATLWIGCALAPTAVALLVYAGLGHAREFVFANFLSVLGQGRPDAVEQLQGAATMALILALPGAFVLGGWRGRTRLTTADPVSRFLMGWSAAAAASLILYWRFASPHYAMPLLLPLACLLARVAGGTGRRRTTGAALVLLGLVAGQVALETSRRNKGAAREAAMVARAADPRSRGCIYVFDGYPALYMLARSCLPTRWPFPAHLSTRDESDPDALGVDPLAELRRVLATRPVAIVDDFPRFVGGNPMAHRLLQATLDARYVLATCVQTGPHRVRLIYQREEEAVINPLNCPSDALLRRGY